MTGGRVVIVGGGVIGVSIALHLHRMGHDEVTVVDAARLGSGTTSAGTGGIRHQFGSEVNIRLVRDSIPEFLALTEDPDNDFRFRQHGYVFAATTPEQLAALTASTALQNSLGVDTVILTPDELAGVAPHVALEGLVGAAYCASDGSGITQDAFAALAAQLRRTPVEIREDERVTGFVRDAGGAVRGATTERGRIEGDLVIIATGPSARATGRLADLDLPVTPRSRQAFALDVEVDAALPFVVDLGTGAYLHPRRVADVVIGGNDREVPESLEARVDWDRVPALMAALGARIPALRGVRPPTRGWAGLREMTPDDHALLGPTGIEGLWVAAGFSGHGFMQSPAVGRTVAELIVQGHSDTDIHALRPDRFREPDAGAPEALAF